MSGELIIDGDEAQLIRGRRAPFTMLPHWITFSGCTAQAFRLYAIFAAHVNVERGDRVVWPGRATLAEMLGLEKPKSVDRYITELIGLGAIDKVGTRKGNGATGPNCYVVHETPPNGFTGPQDLSSWYKQRTDRGMGTEKAETAGQSPAPNSVPPPRYSSGDGGGPQMGTPPQVFIWGPEQDEVQQDEVNKSPSEGASLRSAPSEGAAPAPDATEPPALFDPPPGPKTENDHDPTGTRSAGRRKPKRPLSDGWRPSSEAVAWAHREWPRVPDLDQIIAREAAKAVDWALSEDKRYADHDRFWMNWMRRAMERPHPQSGSGSGSRRGPGPWSPADGVNPWAGDSREATVAAWKAFETAPVDGQPEATDEEINAATTALLADQAERLRRTRRAM